MKVGVVDYKAGNLRSVETALGYLGTEFLISDKAEDLRDLDKLIFPGVGDAGASMRNLREYGLDELITEFAGSGRPLLGICIGYQVVMDASEERDTKCLGLVSGKVRRFPPRTGLKVPHMGWNTVTPTNGARLFHGIPNEASFYFVHSYYPEPESQSAVMARTEYGVTFASAIQQDNLYAVQFHPEKSGKWGLQLLKNFLSLT